MASHFMFGEATSRYVDAARLSGLLPSVSDVRGPDMRGGGKVSTVGGGQNAAKKGAWRRFLNADRMRRPTSGERLSWRLRRDGSRGAIAKARLLTQKLVPLAKSTGSEDLSQGNKAKPNETQEVQEADGCLPKDGNDSNCVKVSDSEGDVCAPPLSMSRPLQREAINCDKPLVDSDAASFCFEMRNKFQRGVCPRADASDKSATTAYLESCFDQAVLPEPVVGKILVSSCKRQSKMTELRAVEPAPSLGVEGEIVHLSHMSIGDRVARTLSSALPLLDPVSLELSDNRLSEAGIEAIAKGLGAGCSRVKTLDLSSNALGLRGLVALGTALCRHQVRTTLTNLALERCSLSSRAIVALVHALLDGMWQPEYRQNANLRGGAMSPASSLSQPSNLNSAFDTNKGAPVPIALRRLNLSRNGLDETAAMALATLIQSVEATPHLRELFLSWTNLRRRAGGVVCRGVAESHLETVDLSWNAWYAEQSTGDDSALSGLAHMLNKAPRLTHLDLSHSRIGVSDVERLGQALESNRMLMGLHFAGNAGACNAYGFLRQSSLRKGNLRDDISAHVFSRILLESARVKSSGEWGASENCWICERWVERRYCFVPGVSDTIQRSADELAQLTVALRTSFDDFEPHPMKKESGQPPAMSFAHPPATQHSGGSGRLAQLISHDSSRRLLATQQAPCCYFELWRMVPPGRHYFSFVLGTTAQKLRGRKGQCRDDDATECVARDQPIDSIKTCSRSQKCEIPTAQGYAKIKRALKRAQLPLKLNFAEVNPRTMNVEASMVRPRSVQRPCKSKWSLKKSIFAQYRPDSSNILGQAFENDYAATNLSKLLSVGPEPARSEIEACDVLRDNYDVIKGAFRQFAISSTEPFNMGWNSFTEFVLSVNLPDRQRLTRADVDMTFFTSSGIGPPGPRNPKKFLCRFQFLDAVVRLALKRWQGTGGSETPADAVRKLIDAMRNLPAVESADDVHAFHDRAWGKETDDLVKGHLELLTSVYDRYSGKDEKPGLPKQMSQAEWMSFVDKAGFMQDGECRGISEREAKQAYARALQTVTDEMADDKHRKLSFIEFIEAILRVIDVLEANAMFDRSDDENQDTAAHFAGTLRIALEDHIPRIVRHTPVDDCPSPFTEVRSIDSPEAILPAAGVHSDPPDGDIAPSSPRQHRRTSQTVSRSNPSSPSGSLTPTAPSSPRVVTRHHQAREHG